MEAGETIQITAHGRPVALIVPIPDSKYERLIREGRIIPAENPGGLRDVEPLPAKAGERPLSEVLMERRASERF